MKIKIEYALPFLIVSIFITSLTCKQQEAKWKGTIEEKDGVTVVKNPKEPVYRENVFSLEEELSIGEAEGSEEYLFSRIEGIDVDNHENLYVLNNNSPHLRVFDKNGEFIKTIGRKGQGRGNSRIPNLFRS